ncbi:glutaredoxin [Ancylostoma duodenale]|uniref:Glutaredoxin n=1 Tax=Ancylostoma duodenale TaxID=51022 RepID=A0A0C2FD96_9BILA|nr:glutaredoxin [Ancylostoma duodenale]
MDKPDDVVVFMEGTEQELMCGFSRNVKLVLEFHNVKFNDYNVLEEAELCEGIKIHSDWPTVPQVYVRGEFVGGSDIMVQMHKGGEISDYFDSKGIPNKYGQHVKQLTVSGSLRTENALL